MSPLTIELCSDRLPKVEAIRLRLSVAVRIVNKRVAVKTWGNHTTHIASYRNKPTERKLRAYGPM